VDFRDFILRLDQSTVQYFFTKIIDVINGLGLDQKGYRLIINNGRDANQEVPHFHIHILAGENLKGIR
jgi:diadenosine tetraphosphate (Ap4A) HIT family hydrolase